MKTIREDLLDIVSLLQDGPRPWEHVPEQEANFDAGVSMTQTPLRIKERIKKDTKRVDMFVKNDRIKSGIRITWLAPASHLQGTHWGVCSTKGHT